MATVDYNDLSRTSQWREGKGGSSYDASSDVSNTTASAYVGSHRKKIKLRGVYVVCTKAWAAGTSVAINVGNKNTVGAYATATVTLAQMATVGDTVSLTISEDEVEANTSILLNSTKSGSMTGNYEIVYDYTYVE